MVALQMSVEMEPFGFGCAVEPGNGRIATHFTENGSQTCVPSVMKQEVVFCPTMVP